MKKLPRHLLLLGTAVLVACGGPALSIATHSSTPNQGAGTAAVVPAHLLVRQGQSPDTSLLLLDTTSVKTLASYPDGVATRDWSRLYAVTSHGPQNLLKVIDPGTARTISVTTTERGFALPTFGPSQRPVGLSPNGRQLVLAGLPSGTQYSPDSNRFLVYDTTHLDRPPLRVNLPGSFLFDGISDDARSLYLLEDLSSPSTGSAYNVRRYDLTMGALDPAIIVDKRTGEQSISGTAIDSVMSRGGAWQYTVYAFGGMAPFVHALNLNDATAFCIDLPKGPLDGELDLLWSVVASHDGRFIYAVNTATGSVVVMPTNSPWQTRRAALAVPQAPTAAAAWTPWAPVAVEAKHLVDGAAVISPDDRILYSIGDTGMFLVDTASLKLIGSLLPTRPLNSITITTGGERLYATSLDNAANPLVQVDVDSGRWAAIAGATGPLSVLRAVT